MSADDRRDDALLRDVMGAADRLRFAAASIAAAALGILLVWALAVHG